VKIQFYSPSATKVTLTIESEDETRLREYSIDAVSGINIFDYDLTILKKGTLDIKKGKNGKYYLPKGKYLLTIILNNKSSKTEFEIK